MSSYSGPISDHFDGERFFDLVRTGQAATVITGFKTGKNEVFPIPQQEITVAGLSQNLGY